MYKFLIVMNGRSAIKFIWLTQIRKSFHSQRQQATWKIIKPDDTRLSPKTLSYTSYASLRIQTRKKQLMRCFFLFFNSMCYIWCRSHYFINGKGAWTLSGFHFFNVCVWGGGPWACDVTLKKRRQILVTNYHSIFKGN